ncbi:hypothetical protein B296_00046901 [Ensete ventricosum]|uniref:Uncharacterized protein n=1 Tax=Ensete ventricosum TaxID=4639 RepID=A0A426XVN1_ENSVE|nr:hypothetical protein B296_00046901 [Ensete ventricosum]
MAVASASVASSTAAAILYCVSPSPVSSGANRSLLEKRPSSLSWSSSIPLVPISSQQLRKPPSSITPNRQVSIAKILIFSSFFLYLCYPYQGLVVPSETSRLFEGIEFSGSGMFLDPGYPDCVTASVPRKRRVYFTKCVYICSSPIRDLCPRLLSRARPTAPLLTSLCSSGFEAEVARVHRGEIGVSEANAVLGKPMRLEKGTEAECPDTAEAGSREEAVSSFREAARVEVGNSSYVLVKSTRESESAREGAV